MILFWIFIFGLCVGSFLNVVIFRLNTGMPIWMGRSKCSSCAKHLAWYELIPVFSFLVQMGKCRTCKTKISWQYLIVEVATAFAFLFLFKSIYLFYNDPNEIITAFIYLAFIWSILIVIFVYDLKHKIIPDLLSFLFAGLGLIISFLYDPSIVTVLSGPIVALPFFLIWLISRGRWIGFGDVKLALGIGWFLGISQGFTSMIVGIWVGAIVGLLLLLLKRKHISMKTEIPFAPFLIIGIAIVFWSGIDIAWLLDNFNILYR